MVKNDCAMSVAEGKYCGGSEEGQRLLVNARSILFILTRGRASAHVKLRREKPIETVPFGCVQISRTGVLVSHSRIG